MRNYLNPCRCECQKQITKNELIVIVKRNSLQKRKSNYYTSSYNKIGTIAMEPKHMDVRRQSLFKSKTPKQITHNELDCFLIDQMQQDLTQDFLCKNFQRNNTNESTLQKFKSVQNIGQPSTGDVCKNQRMLKEKVMNLQIQEETHRKTMKKHANPLKQIKDQAKDMLLTTKRCKKKYNGVNSPPELNKEEFIRIEQIPKHKLLKSKDKQNQPRNIKIFNQNDKSSFHSQMTLKITIDEISLLKKQLKRLQDDEKRLLAEKNQNERFFAQDYAINQKKKQNLKKRCYQRYEELKDLKKLLTQCKNRAI